MQNHRYLYYLWQNKTVAAQYFPYYCIDAHAHAWACRRCFPGKLRMLCIYHQSCVSNYALLSPSRACMGVLISVIKLAAVSADIYTGWCMHDQTQIPINVISPEGLLNFGTEHRK